MPKSARGGRILYASPELVAAATGGFSLGPMLLLVAGHFSAGLGVPLGVAGAVIACLLCGAPDNDATRRDLVCTVAAGALALLWFALNVPHAAQDVYATRDPAAYTISGRWLVDHPSLQLPTMTDVFGRPPGGKVATGSFALVDHDVLNGQGLHLLPAFLGLSGAVFGTTALLATNTVLTALALFVFFGLARRVVSAGWALLAMAALAVSMPILYVGRDTYTEPLTLLFLIGALAFVHRGFAARRPADWALAGMLGGLSTCVRVDTYLALVALVLAAAALAATAPPAGRRRAGLCALALLGGGAGPLVLGWLDLTHVSRQYFDSQHGNIVSLIALLAAATLAAPIAVWLAWRPPVRRWFGRPATERLLARIAGAALVVTVVLLASRPLWQKTRGPLRVDLENMQRRYGKGIDGTRTYDELTLHWIAQYYGVATVVLAVVGYLLLVGAMFRRREHALVGTLVMALSSSALYLWSVKAAPDQPWAMRRYVPVVLPLLLVAAAVALRWLWDLDRFGRLRRPVVAAFAIATVLFPAVVSWPMRSTSEERGQLRQLRDICTAVGKHGAVMEVDEQTVFGYGQAIRSFCNVPAIGLFDATPAQIQSVNTAVRAHGRTLFLVGQSYEHTGGRKGRAFSVVHVERWPTQINEPPKHGDLKRAREQYAIWLSEVDAAGHPHPVAPITPIR